MTWQSHPQATMDELKSIQAARDGDVQAFNDLVRAHQASVFRSAFRILGQSEAASDAVQEAFTSAFTHLQSFRGGSFRGWLQRIVINACYDQLRDKQRTPTTSLESSFIPAGRTGASFPQAFPSPQSFAERSELNEAILEALNELPLEQRVTAVLADVQGFSYEEIARMTGTNIGTVKSRLSRARTRLRDDLAQKGFMPQTRPPREALNQRGRVETRPSTRAGEPVRAPGTWRLKESVD